jgi:hypothetical protein
MSVGVRAVPRAAYWATQTVSATAAWRAEHLAGERAVLKGYQMAAEWVLKKAARTAGLMVASWVYLSAVSSEQS